MVKRIFVDNIFMMNRFFNIKKLGLFLLLVTLTSFAYGNISVTGKIGFALPSGTSFPVNKENSLEDFESIGADVKRTYHNGMICGLGIRYKPLTKLQIPLVKDLAYQGEINFINKNGLGYEVNVGEVKYLEDHKYKSLELMPLAVSYEHNLGNFLLGGLFGINLSIPVGPIEYKGDALVNTIVEKETSTPVIFGLTFGATVGYKIYGPITLLCDFRYTMDTMTFEVSDNAIMLRKNFTGSLGVRYNF